MNRWRLATNVSAPLLELASGGEVLLIDAVEVGPWFRVRQICDYRQRLPTLPFYFHGGHLVGWVGLVPGTISQVRTYLRCTASPWLSVHLTMWLPGTLRLVLRRGWRPPLPDPARATRRLIWQVKRLTRAVNVPVILENMPVLPLEGCQFEAQPQRIARVLEETECDLLLDLAHARVAAAALGMEATDYLDALPLERVVQVHVSGPRMREGRLSDAHEPMQAIDYDLLDWLLARARPQVVTLEYSRQTDALREQLWRLRQMLDGGHDQAP